MISGRRGLVGGAIERVFRENGYCNIIGRSSKELDLRDQALVRQYFEEEKPSYVVLAAAKVGGILANTKFPAEFLYDNLQIQNNVIEAAYRVGVKKLLFLASSCIYPRLAPQPMKEEYLLDGKVEPTNEGYAIAKIAGLKLCEMYNRQYGTDYISVMPCNVYGIGDNFDPLRSHVVAALIRKVHEAKIKRSPYLEVWGTGNARRELIFCDDLAQACLYLFENYSGNDFFNIGTGYDVSIRELVGIIQKVVGYECELRFDPSKPDGMPQKLMSIDKLAQAGFRYKTDLPEGIEKTYQWFLTSKWNREES